MSTVQLAESAAEHQPRVLMLSMRKLSRLVAYSMLYEFEDVVAAVTDARRIDAQDEAPLQFARRTYKYARLLTQSRRLAARMSARPTTVPLDRDYDLFLPIFNHPHELYALATIPDWRKRCKSAACFISELWLHELPQYLLELLSEFDHVFIGMTTPVAEIARITARPCSYLPLAANVLMFTPGASPPARSIDVCNIGRRSHITHQALLALLRQSGGFYYYDTVAASGINDKQRTFSVQDAAEHRWLLASLLKRSQFFLANRSRVNDAQYTRDTDEISGRFYEGIAAGTVLMGEAPRTEAFRAQFNWPDAVLPLPFDSANVAQLLADYRADPQRLQRVRHNNVQQAALRHDWLYRLQVVFATLGVPATDGMLAREQQLRSIAAAALISG